MKAIVCLCFWFVFVFFFNFLCSRVYECIIMKDREKVTLLFLDRATYKQGLTL